MSSPVNLLTPAQSLTGTELFYAVQKQGGILTDTQVTAGQLKSFSGGGGFARTMLNANTSYFVSTAGSDSGGDGSVSKPWATLQHADNVIAQTIDLNGFVATVNIAAGSYVGITNYSGYFSSTNPSSAGANITAEVLYLGDNTTPSNVVITGDPVQQLCYGLFAPNIGELLISFKGVRLKPGGNSALWCDPFFVGNGGATVTLQGHVEVGDASPNASIFSGNIDLSSCTLLLDAAHWTHSSIGAVMDDGAESGQNSIGFFPTGTVTITGTPTFTIGVFSLAAKGFVEFLGSFSGSYVGRLAQLFNHTFFFAAQDWWNLGGTLPPIVSTGAILKGAGTTTFLEATGSQVFGGNTNYQQPSNAFSLTLGSYDDVVILDPSGTLATGTVTMAPHAVDSQFVNIRASHAITSITFSPNSGQSVMGAPTTLSAGQSVNALFKASNSTWYFG